MEASFKQRITNNSKSIIFIAILFILVFSGCKEKKQTNENTENKSNNVSVLANGKGGPAPTGEWTAIATQKQSFSGFSYSLIQNGNPVSKIEPNPKQVFPYKYQDIEGVLTFRGNNLRTAPSFGTVSVEPKKLSIVWKAPTTGGTGRWGGGAGWTGQPSIVKWPKETLKWMNVKPEYKNKEGFTEIIQASLDGNVYFLDLDTGKQTRAPIKINNPIKGSCSIDPRGYPILYVGQGIKEKSEFGYRIFSLVDQKLMYFINGLDGQAYRNNWGAFDGSGIINKDTDSFIIGGENGMLYNIKLNSKWDPNTGAVSIKPSTIKYRYQHAGNKKQGIENSIAVYKNIAFFSDNGGTVQAVDLTTMTPIWVFKGNDDTDATIVIDIEDGKPFIYSGCEVDIQGGSGFSYIRKFDGLTGKIIWEQKYPCFTILGEHPVNGGLLSTPIVGGGNMEGAVVFSIARYKRMDGGLMIALDKKTGGELWRWEMPHYIWSSPVDFYDKNGNMYIIQGNSVGMMYLVEGKTGKVINQVNLGTNIEASPAMFYDKLVVAVRAPVVYCVKVE